MVRIETINFGEIEVAEESILTFKEGIPGFPRANKFAVLEFEDVKPFQYLQSLGEPPVALLVVDPFLIDAGYQFQISNQDMEDVGATGPGDITVCVVATIPENPADATINLMAPVVINPRARSGKQIILHDSGYSVRQPLSSASKRTQA